MYWIGIIFISVGTVFLYPIEINLRLRTLTDRPVVENMRIFCNHCGCYAPEWKEGMCQVLKQNVKTWKVMYITPRTTWLPNDCVGRFVVPCPLCLCSWTLCCALSTLLMFLNSSFPCPRFLARSDNQECCEYWWWCDLWLASMRADGHWCYVLGSNKWALSLFIPDDRDPTSLRKSC
jgi:hypothetical protein